MRDPRRSWTRRGATALLAAAPLAACGAGQKGPASVEGTLEWAVAGPWRLDPERDRDRHPFATLRFWGLSPGMTVLEVYPGRGWYTSILAPYLRATGGRLIVAEWDRSTAAPAQRQTMDALTRRFADRARFGVIEHAVLEADSGPITAPGAVDLAIVARNVHTFIAGGFAEKAFRDIAASLRPGGVLGIEQHRAASTGDPDPLARDGYVQEAYVKALAAEAGLDFVAAEDINANPKDDRDHPFGVWTLPPELRTAPLGEPDDPEFDSAPYIEIGESDRMTLKFRKPDSTGEREETESAP
ncbi:MAG: methyltransferase [Alphaproteobacteria bacterium]|nr:methyltransferase [Alphaproteobacteria bacterium]